MLLVKVADLESKIKNLKDKLIINYQNKTYKRRKLGAKKYKKEIFEIAEGYEAKNLSNIIVEHKNFYSIWVEEISSETARAKESEEKLTETEKEIPTQKIVKKYRGQVYELEVVDLRVKSSRIKNLKKGLKYRGQTLG